MLTVGVDVVEVEQRLAAGLLECPGCGGRLRPWGHARWRQRRGRGAVCRGYRPRRSRCGSCEVTHVLLPVGVLIRRRDEVGVVGDALLRSAVGQGYRRIAWALELPVSTVRGWIRRLRSHVEQVRVVFTVLGVELAGHPDLPEPAGSDLGDAIAAIYAAYSAVVTRFGAVVSLLSVWELASAITGGTLLGPAIRVVGINTSGL